MPGSNRRPHDYKSSALPTELTRPQAQSTCSATTSRGGARGHEVSSRPPRPRSSTVLGGQPARIVGAGASATRVSELHTGALGGADEVEHVHNVPEPATAERVAFGLHRGDERGGRARSCPSPALGRRRRPRPFVSAAPCPSAGSCPSAFRSSSPPTSESCSSTNWRRCRRQPRARPAVLDRRGPRLPARGPGRRVHDESPATSCGDGVSCRTAKTCRPYQSAPLAGPNVA